MEDIAPDGYVELPSDASTFTIRGLPPGIHCAAMAVGKPLSAALQSVAARGLLTYLLKTYYGLGRLPRISVMECGKPFFPDFRHIHFSLSHSPLMVTAAISTSPVGCDVEAIIDRLTPQLLESTLDGRERRAVLSSGSPEREFTRVWTRKEASVKKEGTIPDDPRQWPSHSTRMLTLGTPGDTHILSVAY